MRHGRAPIGRTFLSPASFASSCSTNPGRAPRIGRAPLEEGRPGPPLPMSSIILPESREARCPSAAAWSRDSRGSSPAAGSTDCAPLRVWVEGANQFSKSLLAAVSLLSFALACSMRERGMRSVQMPAPGTDAAAPASIPDGGDSDSGTAELVFAQSSPLMSEVTMPGSLSGVKAGTIPLAPARRATQM